MWVTATVPILPGAAGLNIVESGPVGISDLQFVLAVTPTGFGSHGTKRSENMMKAHGRQRSRP